MAAGVAVRYVLSDQSPWAFPQNHAVLLGATSAVLMVSAIGLTLLREPEGKQPESDKFDRVIGSGTFALQGHDPASLVYFKNILVKRLPDDIAEE